MSMSMTYWSAWTIQSHGKCSISTVCYTVLLYFTIAATRRRVVAGH